MKNKEEEEWGGTHYCLLLLTQSGFKGFASLADQIAMSSSVFRSIGIDFVFANLNVTTFSLEI